MRPNRLGSVVVRTFCLFLVFSFVAPSAVLARSLEELFSSPHDHQPGVCRVFSREASFHYSLQQQASARRTLPPAQRIPPRDFDTRHIRLNLSFDWEREQARGTATITFAPLVRDMRVVEFDAVNMTFQSVALAPSNVALQFQTDTAREKLRINLDRAYQPSDEITVAITYNTNGVMRGGGVFGSFGQGLTFIKPSEHDPRRPRQIWSQGETEYNHSWFPCHDHPNDFATSEMIATVERPLSVISNGRLIETRDNPDNTRTFHWRMEQPHVSYLTSIVVGEYAPVEMNWDGIPVTTYVYPNQVEEGRITAERTPEMMRFFSETTGLRYPYAKYAQTMVRDFGGGMENITATTLTDTTVIDRRTTQDFTSDGLISHELAHQWFGNYVTCRTWADLWLNESFATYFQAMWTEHNRGRDDFLYEDVISNQEDALRAWAQGNRRPIVTNHFANPDAVFDVYAYQRGGAVLHMLRRALGEDAWWRAIRHYLARYPHQPVETAQFRIAVEEATGRPMDWFFDQWVYQMGHPVFRVTQNYNAENRQLSLTVRQEQRVEESNPYPQTRFFQTPVDIEIGTAAGARVERVMIEPQAEQTFTFTVDSRPLLVNFDYGNTLIKELTFEKSAEDLMYQLSRDEDMTGRLWALRQLKARMENDATPVAEKTRIATALAGSLTNDTFWGVRREAASALKGGENPAARTALLNALRDRQASVRVRAIRALATNRDSSLADLYRQALNDQSYAVVSAAALALGQTQSPNAYEALNNLLATESWRDAVRVAGLKGLAALGDARSLDAGLRYAARGNSPAVRAAAVGLLAAVGRADARALPLISDALLQGALTSDFALTNDAAEALLAVGDARGLQSLDEASRRASSRDLQSFLRGFHTRLRERTTTTTRRQ
jgi:aminopeptidase N